jgi:predicted exporter
MFPIMAAICASGYVFYTGKLLEIPLLNYISVCSLVLITGIGMEYSVRALAVDVEGRAVVAKSLFASGVLSIMGFGGIAFCSHAGLRGFGLVLCIGLVICLVFALVVNAAKRE